MLRFVFAIFAGCFFANAGEPIAPLIEHVEKHREESIAPWTIDFAKLKGDRSSLPIGVFDSGIGGLTVLEAILSLDQFNNETLRPGADGKADFAGERFVYLGDQANMPYGNYPAQGKTDFLRELILKDVVFLLGTRWRESSGAAPRNDKPPVKAIVIACNTATAYGIEDIRAALRSWKLDVPVIGVVEAGARDLAAKIPDSRSGAVAVLATVGTCESKAYPKAIARATGQAGKASPVVVQQGSYGLAGAIEGNTSFVVEGKDRSVAYHGPSATNRAAQINSAIWDAYQFEPAGLRGNELNSVGNYARYDVVSLLEQQRANSLLPIETVVLGCTHFPLVERELNQAFAAARNYKAPDGSQPYAAVVAEKLRFIDPAEATARELFVELARARIRNRQSSAGPTAKFFLSVPNASAEGGRLANDGSLDAAYKTGRSTGNFDVEDTVVVPITPATLPASSAKLVRALPSVWKELESPRH